MDGNRGRQWQQRFNLIRVVRIIFPRKCFVGYDLVARFGEIEIPDSLLPSRRDVRKIQMLFTAEGKTKKNNVGLY
jgi:hypothetical protein